MNNRQILKIFESVLGLLRLSFNKNLSSQINQSRLFSISAFYLVTSSIAPNANRACTYRFATPECGVIVELKKKYCLIQAKFLASGNT